MTPLHIVDPPQDRHAYLTSYGRGPNLTVQARCSCGRAGPVRCWDAKAITGEQDDLAGHIQASGHKRLDDDHMSPQAPHQRCGHVHAFHDDCPVPYNSPAGLVIRATRATLGRPPAAAADRLQAVSDLQRWVTDQQTEAVIAARIASCSWDDIAQAAGISLDEAQQRWGALIRHLEDTGLVDPVPRSA